MSVGGFLVLAVIGCAYFGPTIIAVARNHNHKAEIGAWNALFGWTAIMWALAFMWATDDNVSPRPPREPVLLEPLSLPWLIGIVVAAVIVFVLFG
jgi:hypothetical protein